MTPPSCTPTVTRPPTARTESRGTSMAGERRIALLNGPNMSNLGKRDKNIYGTIESLEALEALVVTTGRQFGLAVEPFHSNDEGGLVDWIDETVGRFDGYVINPGGLWAYGDPTRL